MLVTGIFAHSAYRYVWFLFAALTVVGYRLHVEQHEISEEPVEAVTSDNDQTALARGESQ